MEKAPVELVSLASDAVRTATAVGPEWPVRFWAAYPVEVIGDKDRLRQVIDNLLANVRAHTPAGTTTTVRVNQVGDEAEIEVRDAGPGMPDEEARRVFERFYRVDQARARVSGGSGLGLSIVSAIVAAHGGTVAADSSPGQGMTVTVRIPMSALELDDQACGGRDARIRRLSPPPPRAAGIHTGPTADLHGIRRPVRQHAVHDSPGSRGGRRRPPSGRGGRRDRRAGLQRSGAVGRSVRRLHASGELVPVLGRGSRSSTTPASTTPSHRAPSCRRTRRCAGVQLPARAVATRCARLVYVGRPGLAYMDVDLSTVCPRCSAGRAAAVRALRRHDR